MTTSSRFARIDFNIPGIKPVGMELIKLINRPEGDMRTIARTVELDPALLGTVMACANSAMFGGLSEIVELDVALARLGMTEIRRIVFHVVLDSALRSDNRAINQFLRLLWTQSLAVSLTMQRLIQDCPQVRALPMNMISMIYPLGLMHTIGIPVMAINFFDAIAANIARGMGTALPEIFASEKHLFGGFDHFELGAELIRRWELPEYFARVIETYGTPYPELDEDSIILHSLLRMARHIVRDLGFSVLETPDIYWLEGSMLDVSNVDSAAVNTDVLQQMGSIRLMFP